MLETLTCYLLSLSSPSCYGGVIIPLLRIWNLRLDVVKRGLPCRLSAQLSLHILLFSP